ncbi:TPR-like protein [Tilletiopsis washingtonensis]|uniref:TPR-like protein n=1 Tax=Tilletiopsis washingtonensis TaxID=58919 RepID=A0A316Z680_9BASI|nr:TPR-like protein [Tilletiopsis washingtonensis]PWN95643.1 TPR-like protein [Tilletiopsis washingtonensis]
MSFLSGADCGPSNGLSSLLKHSQADRSLQGDRTEAGPGPGAASFRQRPAGAGGPADAQAWFAQQQQHGGPQQFSGPPPSSFEFEKMRAEMERMQMNNGGGGGSGGSGGWAQEMNRRGAPQQHMNMGPQSGNQGSAWSSQFASAGHASAPQQEAPGASATRSGGYGGFGMLGGGMGGMGMIGGGMGSMFANRAAQQQQPQQSSSRFTELSDKQWEDEFARLDAEATADKGKGKAAEPEQGQAEDEDRRVREALDRLESDIQEDGYEGDRRFEELWNAMHAGGAVPPSGADADVARFEEELQRQRERNAEEDDEAFEFYNHPSGGLGGGIQGLNETGRLDGTEDALLDGFGTVGVDGFPRLGGYRFAQDNPFMTHEAPLAEGLRLLANGGSLADAALLFEAATQRDAAGGTGGEQGEVSRALRERSEAWRRLGEAMAMNERETQAIRALEEAIKLDENNLEAYMSLAISYINEGYDAAAHSTLERYMSRAYPHLKPDPLPESISGTKDPLQGTDGNPWASLNRATSLFLAAAREGAAKGTIDPEVQVGLGVLFYSNSSYEQARDCFNTALQARPNDFLLWNRLGATLANSGKPEDAIEAYHKALELRPTFTRAIYNLSVACLNLGAHHEAAEHLLAALSLQQSHEAPNVPDGASAPRPPPLAEAQESHNLWSTLRRIFLVMDRMDLAQQAHVGSDLGQFRAEGFEF